MNQYIVFRPTLSILIVKLENLTYFMGSLATGVEVEFYSYRTGDS